MGEVKELFRAYRVAHKYREQWYNIKWRVLIILASLAVIGFVFFYLQGKYPLFIQEETYEFFLGEKFFYWFMVGSMFGIISVGMIFEGEFLLGLRNIAKELSQAETEIERRKVFGATDEKPRASPKKKRK